MNKRKIGILLNLLLIILEIIGLIISQIEGGLSVIKYYTEESNILCLISSVIVLFYLIKNKKFTKEISVFRFMTVVSLSITFLVVVFVLAPMYDFNYYWLLYRNSSLYLHLLCPIISVISFLFFENHNLKHKRDKLRGIYFTILYAIVTTILNLLDLLEGPYPFLMVKKNGALISIVWLVIMMGSSYLISLSLVKIKNKIGVIK